MQQTSPELSAFCARLQDLCRSSGSPSLALLRSSMPSQPGQSTLSELLSSKRRRPPRWELVAELVQACKAHADKNRRQVPTELASLAEWRRRHEELIKITDAVRRVSQPTRQPQMPRIFARSISE